MSSSPCCGRISRLWLPVSCPNAASMFSVFLLSLLFGLNHEQYVTLLPKSITTASAWVFRRNWEES